MFLWMPDSPIEAKFLSDQDKIIAIERLRDNQMGVISREWRYPHFHEALRDPKTWLWTTMIFCTSVPSNGIGVFGPLIIKSFVSDPYQTILFNIPVGIAHFTAVASSAYVSMRWKVKGPVIAILCVPPIIGLSILLSYEHNEENKGVLLAGFFSVCTFTGISMLSQNFSNYRSSTNMLAAPLIYSWSSQNTAGDTKRKSSSALVFIGASAGNIIGPLLFTPGEAPNYSRGLRANIMFFILVICLVGCTTIYLRWLNLSHSRRRVALGKSAEVVDRSLETAEDVGVFDSMREGDNGVDEQPPVDDRGFSDETDLENEDFVFVF